MGFEGTSFSSYYHMNNSLPTAQWTTLTDLLWPQAVAHGTVLLMVYKEGSVCRLPTLFHLCFSGLVCLAQLSQSCNIYFTGGRQSSKDARLRTPKHTQARSRAGIITEKIHETKTLMYIHLHTCSQKNMHTLSTTRAPYCALERPTFTKGRSISLLSSSTSSSQKHSKSCSMSTTKMFKEETRCLLALLFKRNWKLDPFLGNILLNIRIHVVVTAGL